MHFAFKNQILRNLLNILRKDTLARSHLLETLNYTKPNYRTSSRNRLCKYRALFRRLFSKHNVCRVQDSCDTVYSFLWVHTLVGSVMAMCQVPSVPSLGSLYSGVCLCPFERRGCTNIGSLQYGTMQ